MDFYNVSLDINANICYHIIQRRKLVMLCQFYESLVVQINRNYAKGEAEMTNNLTNEVIEAINSFIESLGLPREKSLVLFESFEDCDLFFKSYHKRNQYMIDDILDFREYKIIKSNKTIDEFVYECYNKGIKYSFESTFYQPFNEFELVLVDKAIKELRTSFQQLYLDFQKNPNKNILKSLL